MALRTQGLLLAPSALNQEGLNGTLEGTAQMPHPPLAELHPPKSSERPCLTQLSSSCPILLEAAFPWQCLPHCLDLVEGSVKQDALYLKFIDTERVSHRC